MVCVNDCLVVVWLCCDVGCNQHYQPPVHIRADAVQQRVIEQWCWAPTLQPVPQLTSISALDFLSSPSGTIQPYRYSVGRWTMDHCPVAWPGLHKALAVRLMASRLTLRAWHGAGLHGQNNNILVSTDQKTFFQNVYGVFFFKCSFCKIQFYFYILFPCFWALHSLTLE